MFSRLCEWWRTRRRGDRRIAPQGVRGRVYSRRDETPGRATARPEAFISARVIRADGHIEDLGTISRPKE